MEEECSLFSVLSCRVGAHIKSQCTVACCLCEPLILIIISRLALHVTNEA